MEKPKVEPWAELLDNRMALKTALSLAAQLAKLSVALMDIVLAVLMVGRLGVWLAVQLVGMMAVHLVTSWACKWAD